MLADTTKHPDQLGAFMARRPGAELGGELGGHNGLKEGLLCIPQLVRGWLVWIVRCGSGEL